MLFEGEQLGRHCTPHGRQATTGGHSHQSGYGHVCGRGEGGMERPHPHPHTHTQTHTTFLGLDRGKHQHTPSVGNRRILTRFTEDVISAVFGRFPRAKVKEQKILTLKHTTTHHHHQRGGKVTYRSNCTMQKSSGVDTNFSRAGT